MNERTRGESEYYNFLDELLIILITLKLNARVSSLMVTKVLGESVERPDIGIRQRLHNVDVFASAHAANFELTPD